MPAQASLCCLDCPDRYRACQDSCERRAPAVAKSREAKQAEAEDAIYLHYMVEQSTRNDKHAPHLLSYRKKHLGQS